MGAKRTAILVGAAAAAAVVLARRSARAHALTDPRLDALAPVAPRSERMVRSADGTEIHVAEYGPEGAPIVVLAHGWTCGIGFFTNQIRALSSDLHVVAYDLRGHGGSAIPSPGRYTTDELADDLAAVLRATVPDGQKAVLFGHSMGAMSIVALAARHSALLNDKAAATLLANTGVTSLVTDSRLQPGPDVLRRLTAPLNRAVLAAPLPLGPVTSATLPLIRYIALAPGATRENVAFCAHVILDTPRTVRGGFGATLGTLDLRLAVPHLGLPTTVVTGEFDILTPPAMGQRLAADLPNARLVEIPGVGHMTPVEAPEVLEREIRALVPAIVN
ncbi:alpha/beta fold hydrolase [Cryptosporangium phraense]|uniref:Alpha/beta hydrolase n=1 Tax=Cryptosporangium phraense TaxID=2593070 RepID=A0A545AKE8_9ACTN|nr:alpha/beta hydrolase [Cryptosporangium phraense]TQS41788.1 alpha/beta hydrolase [Cryptosporangium phraense]